MPAEHSDTPDLSEHVRTVDHAVQQVDDWRVNRGRPTTISAVISVLSAPLILVSGCGAKAKPASPCPSAAAQVATYVAQAQAPASPPTLVPVPVGTSLDDALAEAGARSLNYGADQAAKAAAASASQQAMVLASYVIVQHATCFTDAELAVAHLRIDRAKQ
jgi:hypothetical protein